MKRKLAVVGMVVLLLIPAVKSLKAGPVLNESFEGYAQGVLDANEAPPPFGLGVNSGTNGGWNPWWSPNSPGLRVTGAELGITPHSGTNMVRGLSGGEISLPDFDDDIYNLAFRANNSNALYGNFLLDYWFYDPAGTSNAPAFQDYLTLAFFSNTPTNLDYSTNNPFDPFDPGVSLQALSLGAGDPTVANTNNYQAEVYGVTDGSYDGTGWFDTATPRSIGWHHARITVSPTNSAGNINVSFYIDDMTTATFTNTTVAAPGFNGIELTADNGTVSAYYDDLQFYTNSVIAPGVISIAPAGTNVVVTFPDLWTLQTTTDIGSGIWTDLPTATSPYTNSPTGAQQFYRLKGL